MNNFRHYTLVALVAAFLLFFGLAAQPSKAQSGIENFEIAMFISCNYEDSTGVWWVYHHLPTETSTITEIHIEVSSSDGVLGSQTIPVNEWTTGTMYAGVSFAQIPLGTDLDGVFYGRDAGGTTIGTSYASTTVVDCPVFPPGPEGSDGGENRPVHIDGRMDAYNMAAPVALYPGEDDDGWVLEIWGINEESEGELLFSFHEQDLPEPGDEPILLAEMDGVALYLLPTGELQVNASYLAEPSKTYVFVFEMPSGTGYAMDIEVPD
jgi:hypothetical protein